MKWLLDFLGDWQAIRRGSPAYAVRHRTNARGDWFWGLGPDAKNALTSVYSQLRQKGIKCKRVRFDGLLIPDHAVAWEVREALSKQGGYTIQVEISLGQLMMTLSDCGS